ncbi:hypothetical protein [Mesobacillus foraminis]|uniref:Membrane protein implicated in regulation of membrane protease activity n=1 Tax=Mesobacillus foraminis TaxID=279826 RepID=A0A4R2B427_9BACI|nr:hypothetical protein [Mesobacillus foraminis]TCN21377.1 membrane protein implicated in regulation of membrane protease activity [Mesobacillus foraminis]
MELFGLPVETVYFYALIFSGAVTLLYLFFGDALSGLLDGLINPVLIFSFIAIFSAAGYAAEVLTSFHSILIAVISAIISLILVILLNIFVLIPLSAAEESLVYKETDLRGRTGTVITTVPEDGYGEVLIESISGRIAKPAVSFNKRTIPSGSKVLVIDVADGVLEVGLYEEMENFY